MPISKSAKRVLIVGASGSGTSTLAAAIAARWGHRQLDTDNYLWLQTEPPYQNIRPRDERLSMLRQAFAESELWVLGGSLCGWGDPLIPAFDLVVFLYVPTAIRLDRLRSRELDRYGSDAISPGGTMHQTHREFIEWASQYDTGGTEMRSLVVHEQWLSKLACPVIRLDGDLSVVENLRAIEIAVTG